MNSNPHSSIAFTKVKQNESIQKINTVLYDNPSSDSNLKKLMKTIRLLLPPMMLEGIEGSD
jgi:hypothetical protein